jgi:xylan 1,4-beta-xylosidase
VANSKPEKTIAHFSSPTLQCAASHKEKAFSLRSVTRNREPAQFRPTREIDGATHMIDFSRMARLSRNLFRLRKNGTVRATLLSLALLLNAGGPAIPQEALQEIKMQVNYAAVEGHMPPVWSFFGYDEPNYTYAPNGKKLLKELAALSRGPVYIRVHNILTSGDGTGSLKWGSTNVYTEDSSGKPVYDWTIVDRIFDTFKDSGVRPLVELGFMPQALSSHPDPYRHNFPNDPVSSIYTGWAYPPKDYQKWSELIFQFASHLRARYGDSALKTWLWEVWNEPDIGYWQGTPEEYLKLYDFSVDAVLRAFPEARIGGPDTTGVGSPKSAEFLRLFLEHCTRQKNFSNGKIGARLDFISFHPKGSPKWVNDHVQMGLDHQLLAIQKGFEIVASQPEWRRIPIILGEWDPEGCAACSAQHNPQNAYRNGPLYAAYTAEALTRTLELANSNHVSLEGVVTWAFEFEDQPPFAGFRELATNGIDKPVLNAFRMFGLLGEERVAASSSGALQTQQVLSSGVRGAGDVNIVATRNKQGLTILIWNYHDDDLTSPAAQVDLSIEGLPENLSRALVEHFRVDAQHSNAYAEWELLGSPQSLDSRQQENLQAAGQLHLLDSPSWLSVETGKLHLTFALPRQALSVIRVAW